MWRVLFFVSLYKYYVMTIVLKKNATIKEIEAAKSKLRNARNKKKGGMAKFFGALKRGLDGLEYQKEMRGE